MGSSLAKEFKFIPTTKAKFLASRIKAKFLNRAQREAAQKTRKAIADLAGVDKAAMRAKIGFVPLAGHRLIGAMRC